MWLKRYYVNDQFKKNSIILVEKWRYKVCQPQLQLKLQLNKMSMCLTGQP